MFFFFFKQKTAYEIYQCDWSSDVCSSDLARFDAGTESLDFDDNQQVKFGTGGDSEIYYDGTDRKSVV